jgi:hypothetical protein
MAALEFAVVHGQGLERRLSTPALMRREVAAWAAARKAAKATVPWQLTVATARKQLPHLYPV